MYSTQMQVVFGVGERNNQIQEANLSESHGIRRLNAQISIYDSNRSVISQAISVDGSK